MLECHLFYFYANQKKSVLPIILICYLCLRNTSLDILCKSHRWCRRRQCRIYDCRSSVGVFCCSRMGSAAFYNAYSLYTSFFALHCLHCCLLFLFTPQSYEKSPTQQGARLIILEWYVHFLHQPNSPN